MITRNRIVQWICLMLAGLIAVACGEKAPDDSQASMPGMDGMPGMNMPSPGDSGAVPLERSAAARLGITFARASMGPVGRGTRVVGTLTYAEPNRQYVSARVMGWIEELYADYMGKPVRKGDPLLALYSPELVNAQEEYLAARRLGDESLGAAARRRLELWNIADDQIEALNETGRAQRTLLLRAPMNGEIAEKMVTDGQAVQPGENLFLIADRSILWVDLAVFEADARAIRIGAPVEIAVNALPGRVYRGRVAFIHPSLDEATRTLTVRTEVVNRDGALRPGMYVTAELVPSGLMRLSVPTGAVLPTGTRNLVFVNRGDGQFIPREVIVGARGDSLVEIVSGLKLGDEVVASATYLLDSETNLAAALQGLMLQMGMGLDMGGMEGMPADSAKRGRP